MEHALILAAFLSVTSTPTVSTATRAALQLEVVRGAAPEDALEGWYGWQNILTDGGSIALASTGGGVGSAPVAGIGLVGLGLATPVLHAAHGNYARALISLAARGGVAAYVAAEDSMGGAIVGAGLGLVVMALDAIFLSWDELPPGDVAVAPPPPPPADDLGASVWDETTLAVELHAGLGAPAGLVGGALELSLLPWLAVAAGGGAAAGPQAFVGARARLTWSRWALGLGLNTSFGSSTLPGIDTSTHLDSVLWVSPELYAEHRWRIGWFIRPFAGIGVVAHAGGCVRKLSNAADVRCSGGGTVIPHLGLATGWAF